MVQPPFWKIAASEVLVMRNKFFKGKVTELNCFYHRTEYIALRI